MKKFICAVLCMLLFYACQPEQQKENALVVGTNAEFAPFSFIEEGEICGFEIDVAKEICQRLGKEVVIKDIPFEGLIPELKLHKVDFVAAGMTVTEERKRAVDFTIPYLEGSPLCCVFAKEPYSLDKIVVNEGYTADFFVTDMWGKEPLRLANPSEAMIALKSGRAEVFITAEDTIKPLLIHNLYQDFRYTPIEETSESCAIMLPKGSSKLQEQLNGALEEMRKEGVIEQLKQKWGLS